MKILSFLMQGRLAHFCRPYTNVSRITMPAPVKTNIMGFVGAVLGIERDNLILFDKLKCAVEIISEYKTKSLPMLYRKDFITKQAGMDNTITPVEVIINPKYRIYLSGNYDILDNIYENMKQNKCFYTPYLGLASLFAYTNFEVEWLNVPDKNNKPETVSTLFINTEHAELNYDRIINESQNNNYRIIEFLGMASVTKKREFYCKRFIINLSNNDIPIHYKQEIYTLNNGKNIALF